MRAAGGWVTWLRNASIFSMAGFATSSGVGALLGAVGGAVLPPQAAVMGLAIAAPFAILGVSHDHGLLWLPTLAVTRQTESRWGRNSGGGVAALLWGLDVGLTFTTRSSFSGVWLLTIIAVTSRSPVVGALLFGAYWLGRILPIWTAPTLPGRSLGAPGLIGEVSVRYDLLRLVNSFALLLVPAAIGVAAIRNV